MTQSIHRKVVILFCAMLSGTLSGGAAEIQFKSAAQLSGSLVLLGDIADIRAADAAETEILKRIELFPAPSSGQSRMIGATYVRQLLQLHGVDAQQHQFMGAHSIRLSSLEKKAAPNQLPSTIPAPNAEEVVFATRAIASGEVVREIDVELRTMDKPLPGLGWARSLEAVIGQEATRAFAPGQPLDLRSLRRPVLVQRGQSVSVVAKMAGVRAETTARALENGSHGDLITLESIDTRKKFSAIVTGIQQAEVLALGQMVSDPARGRSTSTKKQPASGKGSDRSPFPTAPRRFPTKVAEKEQKP